MSSKDNVTRGARKLAVMNYISVMEEKYVFIVEGKKLSLSEAMKQCLLALKHAQDAHGGEAVYGFVTTGQRWKRIQDKERWMKDFSRLVDCVYFGLTKGSA